MGKPKSKKSVAKKIVIETERLDSQVECSNQNNEVNEVQKSEEDEGDHEEEQPLQSQKKPEQVGHPQKDSQNVRKSEEEDDPEDSASKNQSKKLENIIVDKGKCEESEEDVSARQAKGVEMKDMMSSPKCNLNMGDMDKVASSFSRMLQSNDDQFLENKQIQSGAPIITEQQQLESIRANTKPKLSLQAALANTKPMRQIVDEQTFFKQLYNSYVESGVVPSIPRSKIRANQDLHLGVKQEHIETINLIDDDSGSHEKEKEDKKDMLKKKIQTKQINQEKAQQKAKERTSQKMTSQQLPNKPDVQEMIEQERVDAEDQMISIDSLTGEKKQKHVKPKKRGYISAAGKMAAHSSHERSHERSHESDEEEEFDEDEEDVSSQSEDRVSRLHKKYLKIKNELAEAQKALKPKTKKSKQKTIPVLRQTKLITQNQREQINSESEKDENTKQGKKRYFARKLADDDEDVEARQTRSGRKTRSKPKQTSREKEESTLPIRLSKSKQVEKVQTFPRNQKIKEQKAFVEGQIVYRLYDEAYRQLARLQRTYGDVDPRFVELKTNLELIREVRDKPSDYPAHYLRSESVEPLNIPCPVCWKLCDSKHWSEHVQFNHLFGLFNEKYLSSKYFEGPAIFNDIVRAEQIKIKTPRHPEPFALHYSGRKESSIKAFKTDLMMILSPRPQGMGNI